MSLTSKQFRMLRELVHAQCGIDLHDGKQQLLQARLARRLRATGIDDVDVYIRKLKEDSNELVRFLDAISTNHTFFFRESHHFQSLTPRHQRIWSAACSSGEEPYSIAIACLEMGFSPRIVATDISTRMLEVAQRGIYPMERVGNLPPRMLKKYFKKGYNRWENHVRVKDELRRCVSFQRFNLIGDAEADGQFDAIFCRNVLIYFDAPTKEKVVAKLYAALKSGGLLVIGGAESLNMLSHRFRYVRPSIYLK